MARLLAGLSREIVSAIHRTSRSRSVGGRAGATPTSRASLPQSWSFTGILRTAKRLAETQVACPFVISSEARNLLNHEWLRSEESSRQGQDFSSLALVEMTLLAFNDVADARPVAPLPSSLPTRRLFRIPSPPPNPFPALDFSSRHRKFP